jgi:hypothetical protein
MQKAKSDECVSSYLMAGDLQRTQTQREKRNVRLRLHLDDLPLSPQQHQLTFNLNINRNYLNMNTPINTRILNKQLFPLHPIIFLTSNARWLSHFTLKICA